MKATPLIINWHDQNAPVYSAHFEPGSQGRLATAGGDNHVRIWKLDASGLERKAQYLCTLSKHNQAVNVVRWAPKGEVIASAGDDGNVILWVPSDLPPSNFGADSQDEKESWRAKHMCRSSGAEIYDLAWSPDAAHFIIGSMDNVARIYSATTGALVRQVAEHSHYVQGVTWDPLNEFIATQSSDRSVHIYSLRTKDGQYTLSQDGKLPRLTSHIKADLPPRRISSNSPAPPEFGHRSQFPALDSTTSVGSPIASQPGTPTSVALPMNPPSVVSHSRRSSFSSRRSASPAPSMPLPAVMPLEASPKPHFVSSHLPPITKNASLYANETLTSFFRRLTFTPDGSLLMTPSGQYQTQHQSEKDAKPKFDVINTVYIYTRGGINKPPIAHLPGHKKPSIAVKCSPIIYTLRHATPSTRHITIDTSADGSLSSLPEPVSKSFPPVPVMEPPPHPLSSSHAENASTSAKAPQSENEAPTPSPKPAFSLPYRMVYAVATQDAVLLYDTQQKNPLCVVSNLHCTTFTDLAWSNDGLNLVISSSDGFCSTLSFAAGELGEIYKGEIGPPKAQVAPTTASGLIGPPNTGTPTRIPSAFAPPSPRPNGALQHHRNSVGSLVASSPPAAASAAPQRPSSPARSNSASSVATQSSLAHMGVASNPQLISGNAPGLTAANTGGSNSKTAIFPMSTPPETPHNTSTINNNNSNNAGGKREASESEREESKEVKRRRVAPTSLGPKPT